MAPKVKVTEKEIVEAALRIVREAGSQALNARTVAYVLQCSTQPIFSNFSSMEELRRAVIVKADELCETYRIREMESGKYPPYKAGGMAYIRFAKEEKELFKLLYMRDRAGETASSSEEKAFDRMEEIVRSNTGLESDRSRLFHLEMWAYVHGIATMFATGYLDLDWDLVDKMLSDAYLGLKKQYEVEV